MKTALPLAGWKHCGVRSWPMLACLLSACLLGGMSALRAQDATNAAPADPASAAQEEKPEAAKVDETKSEESLPEAMDPEVLTQQAFEGGTNSYNNWVEFSVGGLMTRGRAGQGQQRYRLQGGGLGGIEDMHLQQKVATNTTLVVDGRALFDEHDYKLSLELKREDKGYVRLRLGTFRTWDNGAGGYSPTTGMFHSLANDELYVDRENVSFEAGLTLKEGTRTSFQYSRLTRSGQKSSTSWGVVHPGGLPRNLAPSTYVLDEVVDAFQWDITHRIKKTDVGLGLRYETSEMDNAHRANPGQGEALDQKVTSRQNSGYDLFSMHSFTETWIKKNLFFSSGFLFANLDSTFTGSRIYGNDFDAGYVPNALHGVGYLDLNGGVQKREYVLNLNLMATPFTNFVVVPSVRVQKEDWDGDSGGVGTRGLVSGPFASRSERESLDVRERLEARYTGWTNWVVYGSGEWTQGDGNLQENGGLGRIGGIGVSPVNRETEDSRFFQKYALGARWYPLPRLSLDAGGYYKHNTYEYDHVVDSTANNSLVNRYPAYLTLRGLDTYDGSLRMTYRPLPKVSLVSRYEHQWSTLDTTPDPASGLGSAESSRMTSHIFGQNVQWLPNSRLSLQAGFNYVVSRTESPASDYTQAVLEARNSYWMLNLGAGLVVDDKTDLNVGYSYYQTDNYVDNSLVGVPLGAGGDEHGVTALLTRRINSRLRWNLKYGYIRFRDQTSGWNNNFEVHGLFSSVQYRF